MTLVAPSITPPAVGGLIAIDDVSWELYEMLLRETEEQHIRITYDRGRMTLMSPLPIHQKTKGLAGRLVEMATFELDIPISSFGSATWKRQDLAKGLEPDECYYIQSEPLVHGRTWLSRLKSRTYQLTGRACTRPWALGSYGATTENVLSSSDGPIQVSTSRLPRRPRCPS
jgi:hypothetical protein